MKGGLTVKSYKAIITFEEKKICALLLIKFHISLGNYKDDLFYVLVKGNSTNLYIRRTSTQIYR